MRLKCEQFKGLRHVIKENQEFIEPLKITFFAPHSQKEIEKRYLTHKNVLAG